MLFEDCSVGFSFKDIEGEGAKVLEVKGVREGTDNRLEDVIVFEFVADEVSERVRGVFTGRTSFETKYC
jgi:hypothetical protein